jgi:hypothetical protein
MNMLPVPERPEGVGRSGSVALALGRLLVVKSCGAALALSAFFSLDRVAFLLLGRLCVPLCGGPKFRGAFALLSCLVVLLGRLSGVRLGFLAMPSGFAAKPLALAFVLDTTLLGRSSRGEEQQRSQD